MGGLFLELRNNLALARGRLQNAKDFFEKRELLLAVAVAVAFACLFIVSQGRMGAPFIFHDEFGFLANAALLAGLDWRGVTAGTPYYGFGVSLLYVPLYWIFSDPGTIYRGALTINAALAAGLYFAAWRTLRFVFPRETSFLRIGAAVLVPLYPSVFVYTHLVWSETALAFAVLAVISILFSISDRKEMGRPVLCLAVLLAWVFAIHLRALALVLAVLLPACLWFLVHREARRPLAKGLALFLLLMIFAWLGKHYIVTEFLGPSTRGVQHSVAEFASSRLAGLMSLDGMQAVLRSAAYQLFYVVTASYGLVAFGYLFCLYRSLETWKARDVSGLLPWFSLVLLPPVIISVTSLSLIHGQRLDHLFYGRYIEAFLLPYVLFGAAWVIRFSRSAPRHRFFAVVALVVLAGVLVWFGIRGFDPSGYSGINWINLTGWFPQRTGNWRFQPDGITVASAIGVVLLLVLARGRGVFFVAFAAFLFHGAASDALDRFVVPASKGWASIGEQLEPIRRSGETLRIGAARRVGSAWKERDLVPLQAQIQLPVVPLESVYECESLTGAIDVVLVPRGIPCEIPSEIYRPVSTGSRLSVFIGRSHGKEQIALSDEQATNRPSAKISVEDIDDALLGGYSHHILERLSGYYSLRFVRAAMPSINVVVTNTGDTVYGSREMLGVFLTGEGSTQWLFEYRMELPHRMEPGDSADISVPIRLQGYWEEPGEYTVHMALFDREGWNWSTVKSVPIHIPSHLDGH